MWKLSWFFTFLLDYRGRTICFFYFLKIFSAKSWFCIYFLSSRMTGFTNFCTSDGFVKSKKNVGQKKIWGKKQFGVQKSFWSKKSLVQKYFWFRKILCPTNFLIQQLWVQKSVGLTKLWPKKFGFENFGPNKFLGPKRSWVQKISAQKIFW